MKKEFSQFQLSKKAMNGLKGGADAGHVENCHCGGGANFQLIINSSVDLFALMDKRCPEGWACTPQK